MNTDTARQHFTPDDPSPKLKGEHISRIQAWMASKGYHAHDKAAHRQLARFLGYRSRRQITKGLALVGGVGTGKTMWLRLFSRVKIYTASELVEIFKDNRQVWKEVICPPVHSGEFIPCAGYFDLAIDDVGAERKTVNYGERADVIAEALFLRYDLFQRYGALTYITSNLDTEAAIMAVYGDRIESRYHEMFSTIRFNGNDQRKTNGDTP